MVLLAGRRRGLSLFLTVLSCIAIADSRYACRDTVASFAEAVCKLYFSQVLPVRALGLQALPRAYCCHAGSWAVLGHMAKNLLERITRLSSLYVPWYLPHYRWGHLRLVDMHNPSFAQILMACNVGIPVPPALLLQ